MIVVDVETTGVVPGKNGIVAIGAVEFEKPSNQFYIECRISKDTAIDPFALEVNGFSQAQIRDLKKPTEAEAAQQFLDWAEPIKDKTMGGHSTMFDIRMLRAACKAANIYTSLLFGAIDMHNIVYAHMKRAGQPIYINQYGHFTAKADHVYKYVGMLPEPAPHNALTGAKMEAEAMSRLIHGEILLPEFAKYPLPQYLLK